MADILGAERITSVFGHWPSFHDAEVVRLSLDRVGRATGAFASPTVTAEIYAFEMTSEVGADGAYVLHHRSLVTLEFRGVLDLTVDDFNGQNALFGLRIEDVSERQLERVRFEVHFDAAYGLAASFGCADVEVLDVQPWPGARDPSRRAV
jgi:hypothetical protein